MKTPQPEALPAGNAGDAYFVEIPGEPVAQGRGRAVAFRRGDGTFGARVFDPAKSRNWKANAQAHMRAALDGHGPITGPVALEVIALFTCPRSDWRVRQIRPERLHTKRPDADNVLKALKDAAKGVLWLDDAQVCEVHVFKRIAAQGASPGITMRVWEPIGTTGKGEVDG
jgi:Holliday junction resolvase RusA-like endonuclease